jgi:hypothetical protein
MQIDITIDSLTPCLVERKSGKTVDTEIKPIKPTHADYKGWNFNWAIPLKNGFSVYALRIVDNLQIQGMIALTVDSNNTAIHIDIVESAPQNYGKSGEYAGVGGHLFAFACKLAHDNGYNYVYFDAKTNLIEYYRKNLGAVQIGRSQRMIIEDESFMNLITKYYGGNDNEK